MSEQNFELKKTGLKATLPRIRILEVLDATKGEEAHLSAEDIYNKYNKPTEETSMMAPTDMKQQRVMNTRKMISKEVAKDFNILNVMDDLGQTFQLFKKEDA